MLRPFSLLVLVQKRERHASQRCEERPVAWDFAFAVGRELFFLQAHHHHHGAEPVSVYNTVQILANGSHNQLLL